MAPLCFDFHLRVSDRCSMNTQLPMSTSFLVTKRAVPPPPATKMLALSGSICLLVLARTTQLLLPRRCSLQRSQDYKKHLLAPQEPDWQQRGSPRKPAPAEPTWQLLLHIRTLMSAGGSCVALTP